MECLTSQLVVGVRIRLFPIFGGLVLNVMRILDVLRLSLHLHLLNHLIPIDWEYPFIVAKVSQKGAQPLGISSLQLFLAGQELLRMRLCVPFILFEYFDLHSFLILGQCQHFEGICQHLHFDNVLELQAICKIWCLIHLEQPWLALIIYDHVECHNLEAHLVLVVGGQCQFIVVHQIWLETHHRFDYDVFHSKPQFVNIYAVVFDFMEKFIQRLDSFI